MKHVPGAPNVFYRLKGGHVHMRVFINGAKMGDLVCRETEFRDVRRHMGGFLFYQDEADADSRDN